MAWIKNQVKKPLYPLSDKNFLHQEIAKETADVDGLNVNISITKEALVVHKSKLLVYILKYYRKHTMKKMLIQYLEP